MRHVRGAEFQGEYIAREAFDSMSHIHQYLKIKAGNIWQDRWDSSSKGCVTYEFLQEVRTNPDELPSLCFARTQVLTGHGEFGCHLLRIGKADSDECDACPGKTDDPVHRIKECPKYVPEQEEIRKRLRSWPPNLRKISFIEDSTMFVNLVKPLITPPTGLQTQVRALSRFIVRWEKLKNKTQITQCHRCQKWDHTATNCNSKIKCMKCGNEHTTKECDIKKEDPKTHGRIKCANCRGNHLSNSTNCPVYTERLKYVAEKRINKPEPKQKFVEAPRPEQNPQNQKTSNQPSTNCASKITGEDKNKFKTSLN
jgi:hypothetical protein